MPVFNKILIANRGEIAARIIRTAEKMGIATAAIHTPDESGSLHVRIAGESWELNNDSHAVPYLDIPQIISIAIHAGVQAIHPGYGFLSENAGFAEACEAAGIKFIGPRSEIIALMGDKIKARETALEAGLPVIPALTGTPEELAGKWGDMKFPVLVKAVGGGGGRGMRRVDRHQGLSPALESASREAISWFGNGSLYIEQLLEDPRHVEVQILGDNHGNVIHLFERECSIQRRYQKIIEEAPAPWPGSRTRNAMAEAAVQLARSIDYTGAGTVEFLVDRHENFHFLEMNTRIQVEHPVTEIVTGTDIVEEQIRIAAGRKLKYSQDMINLRGHAIECRIYAEDPKAGFRPSPGRITSYHEPQGTGIRVDSCYDREGSVSGDFDGLIAKVTASGSDREDARQRLVAALEDFAIQGIRTNTGFMLSLLSNRDFVRGDCSTEWCEKNIIKILSGESRLKASREWLFPAAGALIGSLNQKAGKNALWERLGYWRVDGKLEFLLDSSPVIASINYLSPGSFNLVIDGNEIGGDYRLENNLISIRSGGAVHRVFLNRHRNHLSEVLYRGYEYSFRRAGLPVHDDTFPPGQENITPAPGAIFSPMPGKVIRLIKQAGDIVRKGEIIAVVESMKMENNIQAPADGMIGRLGVREGDLTDGTLPLLILDPSPDETALEFN
jgi:3-methylcrotonyl-CoA carboxylase alpha subunit